MSGEDDNNYALSQIEAAMPELRYGELHPEEGSEAEEVGESFIGDPDEPIPLTGQGGRDISSDLVGEEAAGTSWGLDYARLARYGGTRKRVILFVEDDQDAADDYRPALQDAGYRVIHVDSVEKAKLAAARFRHFEAVVLDIRMEGQPFFGPSETGGRRHTGVCLGRELVNDLPDARFIALTNSTEAFDAAWFEANHGSGYRFCSKRDFSPEQFARLVDRVLKEKNEMNIKTFIVHGHDKEAWLDLKNYLQNRLHTPEPIVLKEKATVGNTIIEKFEKYANDIDVAFVIMTPDDLVDAPGGKVGRARQNVLFELGYFVGSLRRKSGRVVLLTKKGTDIPSDLAGVGHIDITNGVLAAGEEIRIELQAIG